MRSEGTYLAGLIIPLVSCSPIVLLGSSAFPLTTLVDLDHSLYPSYLAELWGDNSEGQHSWSVTYLYLLRNKCIHSLPGQQRVWKEATVRHAKQECSGAALILTLLTLTTCQPYQIHHPSQQQKLMCDRAPTRTSESLSAGFLLVGVSQWLTGLSSSVAMTWKLLLLLQWCQHPCSTTNWPRTPIHLPRICSFPRMLGSHNHMDLAVSRKQPLYEDHPHRPATAPK